MIFWKSKKQKQEEMRQQYMKDFILLYMLHRLEQQMHEQLKENQQ